MESSFETELLSVTAFESNSFPKATADNGCPLDPFPSPDLPATFFANSLCLIPTDGLHANTIIAALDVTFSDIPQGPGLVEHVAVDLESHRLQALNIEEDPPVGNLDTNVVPPGQITGQTDTFLIGPVVSADTSVNRAKKKRSRHDTKPATARHFYGRRGYLRCEQCRKWKQKCVYESPEQPCEICREKGRPCGPKVPTRAAEIQSHYNVSDTEGGSAQVVEAIAPEPLVPMNPEISSRDYQLLQGLVGGMKLMLYLTQCCDRSMLFAMAMESPSIRFAVLATLSRNLEYEWIRHDNVAQESQIYLGRAFHYLQKSIGHNSISEVAIASRFLLTLSWPTERGVTLLSHLHAFFLCLQYINRQQLSLTRLAWILHAASDALYESLCYVGLPFPFFPEVETGPKLFEVVDLGIDLLKLYEPAESTDDLTTIELTQRRLELFWRILPALFLGYILVRRQHDSAEYLDRLNRICDRFLKYSLKVLGFDGPKPDSEVLDGFLTDIPAESVIRGKYPMLEQAYIYDSNRQQAIPYAICGVVILRHIVNDLAPQYLLQAKKALRKIVVVSELNNGAFSESEQFEWFACIWSQVLISRGEGLAWSRITTNLVVYGLEACAWMRNKISSMASFHEESYWGDRWQYFQGIDPELILASQDGLKALCLWSAICFRSARIDHQFPPRFFNEVQ